MVKVNELVSFFFLSLECHVEWVVEPLLLNHGLFFKLLNERVFFVQLELLRDYLVEETVELNQPLPPLLLDLYVEFFLYLFEELHFELTADFFNVDFELHVLELASF